MTRTRTTTATLVLLAALSAMRSGRAATPPSSDAASATRPASSVPAPPATTTGAPGVAPLAVAPGDVVRWMPQGTQLLVRVRFSDMRTSALFRSLMSSKPLFAAEMAPLERAASEMGLDLGRDLDVGWIGTDGRTGGTSVSILTIRRDAASLSSRLKARGAQPSPYGDLTLHALAKRASAGGGETLVAFPRTGMMLVGSRDWVCITIDRLQGRGSVSTTALASLIGRTDPDATIWSAAKGSAVSGKIRSEWSTGSLEGEDFDAIQSLVATFRIAGDLRIDSEAKAQDEDADALLLALKGLVAVSGLRASVSDPSLAEVLRATRIDRTDGGVRLTARIPAAFASRL